ITLAGGVRAGRVVAHYLGVATLITLVGGLLGGAAGFAVGALARGPLGDAGKQLGVPLEFEFDWVATAAIQLLLLAVAWLSVAIPAARATRLLPATLLRMRDR